MYDLNLSVPNITAEKYTTDNRFTLLKNYLYELNEALAVALGEQTQSQINTIRSQLSSQGEDSKATAVELKKESINKLNKLKEQIIRTAQEIEVSCDAKITASEEELLSEVGRTYVSKSEHGEYESAVNTSIQQNADEISLVNEKTEEVRTDLENFKSSSMSEITVLAGAILSQVEQSFLSKTEGTELESRVGSLVTQTETSITENFSNDIAILNDDISSVGGAVQNLISELDVYIRRGELESGVYGIEIGRSDSSVKARFTNERLSFYQGVSEVAYISGSSLYITNADILDYLRIGDETQGYFLFDTTSNGLEVRWIDGN